LKKKGFLNPTLGGYINKIVSFWLIKRTEVFLGYLTKRKNLIQQLFNHLYLTHCVTDIVARLCTIQDIKAVNPTNYMSMRTDVVHYSINMLDQHSENDFITEQIFDILSSIVKKCYLMVRAREFFDELLSPFIFLPLLEFSFEGGAHTK
jgi:hypothetical protein